MENTAPFAIGTPRPEHSTPVAGSAPRSPRRLLRLDADVLFRAGPEVEILQAGEVYRLRRTRANKLILTK